MKSNGLHFLKGMFSMIMVLALVATSLVFNSNSVTAATNPTISKSKLSLAVGKTATLKVENKIKGSTYTWSSSKKTVATVSKTGVVKAVKEGTATITCNVKAPKKTYSLTCKVTVTKAAKPELPKATKPELPKATKPELTNIKSIKYDFTITGATKEAKLEFKTLTMDWVEVVGTIPVKKDDKYSVTLDFGGTAGLTNLGFIATIEGSPIIAKLTKITVNETYEMDCEIELQVGVEGKQGLMNIWNGDVAGGTKFIEGANSYFIMNSDKTGLQFYAAK
jgi:hypothetical protein